MCYICYKWINLLCINGFHVASTFFYMLHFFVKFAKSSTSQRISCSTKRATFFQLLYFQMLIISIITFSMYVISRTIQNISFNMPYDLTMRIKSLICKITRFYMKIFVTSSYGTLNGISMIFPCITKK